MLALALLLAPEASTAPNPAAPTSAPVSETEAPQTHGPTVRVRADPSVLPVSEATVRRALDGHLADLGVALTVDLAPTPEDPGSDMGVDLDVEVRTAPEDGLLLRIRRAGEEPWVRTLPAEAEPGLLLESLGVVLRGIVVDLPTEDVEPANEPAAGPESAAVDRVPAPKPGSDLALSLGARGDTVSPGHPWHTGVAADLGWRAPTALSLNATVAWVPRHRGAGLHLTRWVASGFFGASFRRTARVQPGVWTLGAIEAIGWSAAPRGAQARPGWAVRGALGVAADLRVTLGPAWMLTARLSALAWVRRLELVEASSQGPRTLTRTAPLSGTALLTVGYRWTLGPTR